MSAPQSNAVPDNPYVFRSLIGADQFADVDVGAFADDEADDSPVDENTDNDEPQAVRRATFDGNENLDVKHNTDEDAQQQPQRETAEAEEAEEARKALRLGPDDKRRYDFWYQTVGTMGLEDVTRAWKHPNQGNDDFFEVEYVSADEKESNEWRRCSTASYFSALMEAKARVEIERATLHKPPLTLRQLTSHETLVPYFSSLIANMKRRNAALGAIAVTQHQKRTLDTVLNATISFLATWQEYVA